MLSYNWLVDSALSEDESLSRLKAEVPEAWTLFSRTVVYGEIRGRGGILRKGGFHDPLFRTPLCFQFEPSEVGTRIICRSTLNCPFFAFVLFWVVLVIAQSVGHSGGAEAGMWAPVIALGAGLAMTVVAIALTRRNGAWLANFVARTVNGRIIG